MNTRKPLYLKLGINQFYKSGLPKQKTNSLMHMAIFSHDFISFCRFKHVMIIFVELIKPLNATTCIHI